MLSLKKMAVLSYLAIPIATPALAGPGSSGGGAQIESAFRLRAMELIGSVAKSPEADARCSAKTMQSGLEGAQIRVVPKLTLPQAASKQILDAWTAPGDMQLMEGSWKNFLDPSIPKEGRSVDALILHEVYRSTGICNDENFKISDTVFTLIKFSKKYSKTYLFPYKAKILILLKDGQPALSSGFEGLDGICDRPLTADTDHAVCIYHFAGDEIADLSIKNGNAISFTDEEHVYSDAIGPGEKIEARFTGMKPGANNLINQVSPDMPLIVVLDLQTGAGAYGLDPTYLTLFDQ